ncbi:uncharacterized protein LOC134722382 [Mytilus trossulus]|uniref:uncharacterized protein LOC134722382 n=1 Tax=Mytilus trossulus TaxID=6551 RepID=UPI003007B69F
MAMITESNIYCGPCESQHSTSVAEFWCPNCDEGLCSKCMEYHKVSKASRMHKTITIENFTALPEFVRNIDNVCSSHDNTLDLYCSVHEKVCCMDCISAEHSECPGITSLNKVVQGVKESAFYHSVVENIEDLTEFATKLQTNRKDNVDKLQHEKDLLIRKVKSKRAEIESHLDKLEAHLLQELDSTINLESQQIEQAVSLLQKKICTLKEYKNHISVITDIATDIQAFIALKEIHRNVVHEEETMLSVKEATGMKEISVRIQFVKEIEELVQEMKSMGNVELTKIATNMHFPGTKSHLVKTLSDIQPGKENIKLTFLTKFQLPFDVDINICSCVILPDERVVLANNSNEEKGGIHIFDKCGEYKKHIVCTSKPFGLAVINKSDIAVSFYKEQSIKVYDSESFKQNQQQPSGSGVQSVVANQYLTVAEFYEEKKTQQLTTEHLHSETEQARHETDKLRHDTDKTINLLTTQIQEKFDEFEKRMNFTNISQLEERYRNLEKNYTELGQKFKTLLTKYTNKDIELNVLRNKTMALEKSLDIVENSNNVLGVKLKALEDKLDNKSIELSRDVLDLKNLKNIEPLRNLYSMQQQLHSVSAQTQNLLVNEQARSQDFLALYNKTRILETKVTTQFRNLENNQNVISANLTSQVYGFERILNSTLKAKLNGVNETNDTVLLTSCVAQSGPLTGIIKFPSIQDNIGINELSSFISSGQFTCENPGLYQVFVRITSGVGNKYCSVQKNGSEMSKIYIAAHIGDPSDWHTGIGLAILELKLGDVVWIEKDISFKIETDPWSCITIVKLR